MEESRTPLFGFPPKCCLLVNFIFEQGTMLFCSKAFEKCHVNYSEHHEAVAPVPERLDEITVILYGDKPKSQIIATFISKIAANKVKPTAIYILNGSFKRFSKTYAVVTHTSTRTQSEQPGPLELLPATRQNPAVFVVHRNQFQHCKATIAILGCATVMNISSRRLYLKTAVIKLDNVLFDGVSEPYDEAIAVFESYVEKTKKKKGNVLPVIKPDRCAVISKRGQLSSNCSSPFSQIIDETGCDYATLLVGWYWIQRGHNIEAVCEQLTLRMGELDPWYCDVLRAWKDAEVSATKI